MLKLLKLRSFHPHNALKVEARRVCSGYSLVAIDTAVTADGRRA